MFGKYLSYAIFKMPFDCTVANCRNYNKKDMKFFTEERQLSKDCHIEDKINIEV